MSAVEAEVVGNPGEVPLKSFESPQEVDVVQVDQTRLTADVYVAVVEILRFTIIDEVFEFAQPRVVSRTLTERPASDYLAFPGRNETVPGIPHESEFEIVAKQGGRVVAVIVPFSRRFDAGVCEESDDGARPYLRVAKPEKFRIMTDRELVRSPRRGLLRILTLPEGLRGLLISLAGHIQWCFGIGRIQKFSGVFEIGWLRS